MKRLEGHVRSIPDFPEPGVVFRDVTSILQNADGLHMAVDSLTDMVKDLDYDLVIDPGSRGPILRAPATYIQHKGLVSVRRKGRLPCETIAVEYDLECGQAAIKIRKDIIRPGQKVIIIDDLIATGGTTEVIVKLIEQLGEQVVKICFATGLTGLNGQEHLKGYDVDSAIIYEGKWGNEMDLVTERPC